MKSGKLDEELSRMSEISDHLESGERTFKIVPGEPLQTAYGEDLYQKIFGQSEV